MPRGHKYMQSRAKMGNLQLQRFHGPRGVPKLVAATSKSVSGSLLWEAVLAGWNEQTGDRNWEANAVAGLSRRVHDAWLEDRDSLTLTRLAVMMGHHDAQHASCTAIKSVHGREMLSTAYKSRQIRPGRPKSGSFRPSVLNLL